MNRGAADLFSALLSLAPAFVDPFAVAVSRADGQQRRDEQK